MAPTSPVDIMAIEGWDGAGNPFYPKGTNRVGPAQEAGSKELSDDFEPFVACSSLRNTIGCAAMNLNSACGTAFVAPGQHGSSGGHRHADLDEATNVRRNPILQQPYEVKGGKLHIPNVPGIGLEWDEKAVAAHLADNF
jgi:hypothetical protein